MSLSKESAVSRMDYKIFNDSVHGHMAFHPLIVAMINTPQIQRLRNIKQLGVAYYVYPSACNNRFEHSLGTSWLAGKLVEALNKNEDETVQITKAQSLCVQIAGLCHDLGHGPFSHLWEEFLRRSNVSDWKHENISLLLFDDLLKEECIQSNTKTTIKDLCKSRYGLQDNDFQVIKDMIRGSKSLADDKNDTYLYQIISNSTNDIDVDKWDYLSRDTKMLNIPVNFDYRRLLEFCKIAPYGKRAENQICYREKEFKGIVDMFMTRASLHERAYQHTVVKIIDMMLTDALLKANNKFQFQRISEDAAAGKLEEYKHLTDHIFYEILYSDDVGCEEARTILKRIETRKLYKKLVLYQKATTPDKIKNYHNWESSLKNKILQVLNNNNSEEFKDEDIGMTIIKIDLGKSNEKKLFSEVYVYKKENPNVAVKISEEMKEAVPTASLQTLENLARIDILVVYKGEDKRPDIPTKDLNKIIEEFFNIKKSPKRKRVE